jgi:hypothetical protein
VLFPRNSDEARIRDRRFIASELITSSPLQAQERMSKIDRYSDFMPSRSVQQQRILTRTLGCGVEDLVAQLGTKNAVKRVEAELRRAKRARSRKLYAFWSAVLARIEIETG